MTLDELEALAKGGEWLNVADASRELDVTTTQLHSGRANGTIPGWMRKEGRNWLVDIHSPELSFFLQGKVKKSNQTKKGHLKRGNSVSEVSQSKLQELTEQSAIADLEISISKAETEKYKAKKAKLDLEQRFGDLVSRKMAEFLYFGYLDRLNRESLQAGKKLEPKIEQIIVDIIMQARENSDIDPKVFAKKIRSIVGSEISESIRIVKESQQATLKKWAEDERVDL
jgi:hypothetical protein